MENYHGIQVIRNSHLPDELKRFVKQDTYLLLLKGAAGTGKTTLALTILRALNVKENCLCILTRTSPYQLFEHYPWLEEFFGESKPRLSYDSELSANLPIFVDAKLEEPPAIFEMITSKLMDTKAPTLIIDTWDPIGYSMDREALISNIRVLETWCRRARAKLILITEQAGSTVIDFMADGVVTLKQKYHNDRRVREISFPKLSGVRINKPSYIFTLNNGIFRSYRSHNPSDFIITSNWMNSARKDKKPRLKRNESFITTGYKELDSLLQGGFPAKGVVNIELDSGVNPKVAVVFLSKVISNFVATDNPVLFQPFEGLDQEYIDHYLRSSLSMSSKRELVRISGHNNEKPLEQITIGQANMSMEKKLASFQEILSKMRKEYPNKFLLNIMGSDIVQRSRQGTVDDIESLTTFLRSNADLSVIVSRRSQDTEYISGISDIYLKIIDVRGTLLLQPQKPWSNLYAIVIKKYLGYPSMKLEPLV